MVWGYMLSASRPHLHVSLVGTDGAVSVAGVARGRRARVGPTPCRLEGGFGNDRRRSDAGPIAGARVVAIGAGTAGSATTSADDGTYTLRNLAAGFCTIQAHADGWTDASVTDVAVEASATTSGVDLTLSGAGEIQGVVTADDLAVPGAFITLSIGDISRPPQISDAHGRFTFTAVPAGDWTLTVASVPHHDHVASLHVSAGETQNMTIELRRAAHASGAVLDATGRPAAGVAARLVGPGGYERVAFTDAFGRFICGGLVAGDYTAMLLDGSQRQSFTITGDVSAPSVSFTMPAHGSIHGHVVAADGETPLAAFVALVADSQIVAQLHTGEAGEYTFAGVAPGTYEVRFTSLDTYFPSVSAAIVSVDATTEVPMVIAGGNSLTVTVLAFGQPVTAGGLVVLDNADAGEAGFSSRFGTLDPNGVVSFENLVAGPIASRRSCPAAPACPHDGRCGRHHGLGLAVAPLTGYVRDNVACARRHQ
jgi:hypothetical protein